jgi:hypothetical protein
VSRPRSGAGRAWRGRWRAVVALAVLGAAGCAVFRAEPLDVPPGHRLVLGRVDIGRLGLSSVVVEIVREDKTFSHELALNEPRTTFVITLPPGRYQVLSLRLAESGRTMADKTIFRLRVSFEVVDAPAVYVGTLLVDRVGFGDVIRADVQDDYDRTVGEIRGRHPELPALVARSLMKAD